MLKSRVMKRLILFVGVVGLCSFVLGDFTRTKVKNVSFDLPQELEKLNEEAVILKYGMHRVPWAVYTDHTGNVMFSVNMIQDTIKYKGTKGVNARDHFFEKMFLKVSVSQAYSNIEWHMDSLRDVGNKKVISFEFTGSIDGQDAKGHAVASRNYNFLQYCFIKNKKYIFNFACPEAEKATWQPMAQQMMNTLKIN